MSILSKRMKEHEKLSLQLNIENLEPFGTMSTYLRASSLSQWDAEDAIGDVLEMILSAQEREERATDIFGNNLQQFCNEIIQSYGKTSKTRKRKEFLSKFIQIFLIFFAGDLIRSYVNTTSDRQMHYYLDTFLLTFLFLFFQLVLFTHLESLIFKISYHVRNFAKVVLYLLLFITMSFLPKSIINLSLITLPFYLAIFLILILFYISRKLTKSATKHETI